MKFNMMVIKSGKSWTFLVVFQCEPWFSHVSCSRIGSRLSSCARYPGSDGDGCREMFWTAGQRVDLTRESPFAWKRTPGTGSCCEGPSMTEMTYTNWADNEPNNHGGYDAHLRRTSPHVTEKCMQICHGFSDRWNDALCEIQTCSICEIDLWTSHVHRVQ